MLQNLLCKGDTASKRGRRAARLPDTVTALRKPPVPRNTKPFRITNTYLLTAQHWLFSSGGTLLLFCYCSFTSVNNIQDSLKTFCLTGGDALHRGQGKVGEETCSEHIFRSLAAHMLTQRASRGNSLEALLAPPVTWNLVPGSYCPSQLLEVLARRHSFRKKPKNGRKPVASQEEGRPVSPGRGQS